LRSGSTLNGNDEFSFRYSFPCLECFTSYVSALLLILLFSIRFANLPCGLRTELFNPTQCETLRVFRHSARGIGLMCLFSDQCLSTCFTGVESRLGKIINFTQQKSPQKVYITHVTQILLKKTRKHTLNLWKT